MCCTVTKHGVFTCGYGEINHRWKLVSTAIQQQFELPVPPHVGTCRAALSALVTQARAADKALVTTGVCQDIVLKPELLAAVEQLLPLVDKATEKKSR